MADLWPAVAAVKRPATTATEDSCFTEWLGCGDDNTATAAAATYTCPTCDDADAVDASNPAEVVCRRCGTIVDIPLDHGAEYRFFSNDSSAAAAGGGGDPSRCSFPVNHLMPESSLGTIIQIRGASSSAVRRIRRYHMWSMMPYREHALWKVFEVLQIRASNAGIGTAVLDEAKELYAQLTATSSCRGQAQRDAALAACLWEALKRHDAPRMPRDIAEIFAIPLQAVTRGIKQFQHVLTLRASGLKTDTYTAPLLPAPTTAAPESRAILAARAAARLAAHRATAARTTSYEDFVCPFITNLSVPRAGELEELTLRICARTEELGIVPENTPPSLTASVIAFAARELGIRVDSADLARVCGISAVTIAKCLKRMAPWKEKLLAE